MDKQSNGIYRIACAVPKLTLGDPAANAMEIEKIYAEATANGASIVLTPELSLTGASCGDLFWHRELVNAAYAALASLVKATKGNKAALIVGLPVMADSSLFNCAAVLQDGKIAGLSASTTRKRQFSPACVDVEIMVSYPFLNDQNVGIFPHSIYDDGHGFRFGIEFGEEALLPVPPSADYAQEGAQAILCMASYPETATSAHALKTAVKAASARLMAAYAIASAGVHESTSDTVCAGHALVAQEGEIVAENAPFARESTICYSDIIPKWFDAQRMRAGFASETCKTIATQLVDTPLPCVSTPDYLPLRRMAFIPDDASELAELCENALSIQAAALAKRVEVTHSKRLVLGVSGGLDSTLALIACARCCDLLKMPRNSILAITMPGMGTSSRTKSNAIGIMRELGAEMREISIKDAVLQHFKDIGHSPDNLNVVYENAQARERTQILMDIANEENGLLIGTGDLSEIAMGWCTFNGDHISMYGINGSIPKTLMRSIISYVASKSSKKLAAYLKDIIDTPVSPELLPGAQHTEDIIGNYELHDFFLYHFIRHASPKEELYALACHAFKGIYTKKKIESTLQVFLRRFFTQQFKRNVMTDGPLVTDISLSPRGAWQMPSDTAFTPWK